MLKAVIIALACAGICLAESADLGTATDDYGGSIRILKDGDTISLGALSKSCSIRTIATLNGAQSARLLGLVQEAYSNRNRGSKKSSLTFGPVSGRHGSVSLSVSDHSVILFVNEAGLSNNLWVTNQNLGKLKRMLAEAARGTPQKNNAPSSGPRLPEGPNYPSTP